MPESPLAGERSSLGFLQGAPCGPWLLRADVQQRFGRAHVVPVFVGLLAERPGEQLLTLFALADADVPRADFRLAGVVLRVGRDHLLEQLFGLGVLACLGVHVTDPLPVAAADSLVL